MKQWTVTSEMRKDGPVYLVKSKDGEIFPGYFDCERSAQELADHLNGEDE